MRRCASYVLLIGVLGCAEDDTASEDGGDSQGAVSTSDGGSSGATASTGSGLQGTEGLVTIEGWNADPDPASDPFGPRAMGTRCDVGFGVEGGLFEIDSGLCTWGTFAQPSRAPIALGDALEFVLVHDNLYSEQQGVAASLGIAVGGDIVWEQQIPIPAEAAFLRPTFEAPADAPVGTPLRFHVHNHGVNNYRLVDFTVTHR